MNILAEWTVCHLTDSYFDYVISSFRHWKKITVEVNVYLYVIYEMRKCKTNWLEYGFNIMMAYTIHIIVFPCIIIKQVKNKQIIPSSCYLKNVRYIVIFLIKLCWIVSFSIVWHWMLLLLTE